MALSLSAAATLTIKPSLFQAPRNKQRFKIIYSPCSSSHSSSSFCIKTCVRSEASEGGGLTDDQSHALSDGSLSSTRSQLDLLEQLTSSSSSVNGYESDGASSKLTIRERLVQLAGDRDSDFSLPLGKDLKKVSQKFLTISQKRNIRRQTYLNEVSQRKDSVFFATVGAFVLLPPIFILGVAILTGYVQLFP